jgi:hypothetical protein
LCPSSSGAVKITTAGASSFYSPECVEKLSQKSLDGV